ncbi:NR0B1 protein, partial [Polyodon spathula]|nr:nuclear receptor subfamily 0 group B member 1-like [Polyodon spathula]MBN3279654.1 NR0B1 protein [Polyodon spathula]
MDCYDGCRCSNDKKQSSILYNILKNDKPAQLHRHQGTIQRGCACGSMKKVALRFPQVTCKTASAVLVKTLKFMKNLPCFQELPVHDQLALVRSCWAPLLLLGLAQDRVDFETTETPKPSMLQRILTSGQDKPGDTHRQNDEQLSTTEIQGIKAFLEKCWALDISTKEYAYLKGAVLFNPDVPGLRRLHYIHCLQSEAQQALNEYVKIIHREDHTRSAKVMTALSMLRLINGNVIAELFFRPIIGEVNMDDLLLEVFYAK